MLSQKIEIYNKSCVWLKGCIGIFWPIIMFENLSVIVYGFYIDSWLSLAFIIPNAIDATHTPHGDGKNTTLSDCVQRHMVRKGRIHFPLFNSEIFPSSTKAPSNYKTPILNQSESGRRSNQLIHFLIVQ